MRDYTAETAPRRHKPAPDTSEIAEPSLITNLRAELGALRSERSWIVEGVLESREFLLWVGPEKSGKSWTLVDLAVSVVSGTRFLRSFAVSNPGPVVYVDSEYGPPEFARRFGRIARGHDLDPAQIVDDLGYVYARGWSLTRQRPHERKTFDRLCRDVEKRRPRVIVIDPLRNVLPGDENDAEIVREFFDALEYLRAAGECPIVIAHHLNRAGSYAGSRALLGRADLIVEGSDEECPWYSSKGRTMRRGDPLQERFTVAIEHEQDGDDLRARTVLRARFAGGSAEEPATLTDRVLALVAEHQPVRISKLKRLVRRNHPACKRVLTELEKLGVLEEGSAGWSLAADPMPMMSPAASSHDTK